MKRLVLVFCAPALLCSLAAAKDLYVSAAAAWKKLSKKADRHNKKGGVVIQGTASYLGNMSYSYPVGVIVDSVTKK